ncbi:hypothetical protein HUU59_10650 [bacterium]|nr:hypothetical protein [bacterium]
MFDRLPNAARRLLGAAIRGAFPAVFEFPLRSFGFNKKLIQAYFYSVLILLIVQGVWALTDGTFWPDKNPLTKQFLEDTENLLNYAIVVPVYLVFVFAFLGRIYTLDEDLKRSDETNMFDHRPQRDKPNVLSAVIILLISLFGTVGYVHDVMHYSSTYWFMSMPSPNVGFSLLGYYYILVNFVLLFLISWVGMAHFKLFSTAARLGAHLKTELLTRSDNDLYKWRDESKIKRALAPLSKLVVISKALILMLSVNMFLWKKNESNIGYQYDISIVILAMFGIWVFSIPRYYIQLHVFKIWKKLDYLEYKDLRMPWIYGLSSLINVILIGILIKVLLGETWAKLIDDIFS